MSYINGLLSDLKGPENNQQPDIRDNSDGLRNSLAPGLIGSFFISLFSKFSNNFLSTPEDKNMVPTVISTPTDTSVIGNIDNSSCKNKIHNNIVNNLVETLSNESSWLMPEHSKDLEKEQEKEKE
ncbi:MAG: hypothetical protein WD512_05560, partial [Candidatus Paceibacterota bacterium]